MPGYQFMISKAHIETCKVKSHWISAMSEAYLELSLTSKLELFAKIVNGWKTLIIFAKSSITDARLDSENTSPCKAMAGKEDL